MEKEWTEWVEERNQGLEEAENLKKQAEELAKVLPTDEDDEESKVDADMKVDEDKIATEAAAIPLA